MTPFLVAIQATSSAQGRQRRGKHHSEDKEGAGRDCTNTGVSHARARSPVYASCHPRQVAQPLLTRPPLDVVPTSGSCRQAPWWLKRPQQHSRQLRSAGRQTCPKHPPCPREPAGEDVIHTPFGVPVLSVLRPQRRSSSALFSNNSLWGPLVHVFPPSGSPPRVALPLPLPGFRKPLWRNGSVPVPFGSSSRVRRRALPALGEDALPPSLPCPGPAPAQPPMAHHGARAAFPRATLGPPPHACAGVTSDPAQQRQPEAGALPSVHQRHPPAAQTRPPCFAARTAARRAGVTRPGDPTARARPLPPAAIRRDSPTPPPRWPPPLKPPSAVRLPGGTVPSAGHVRATAGVRTAGRTA